MINKKWKKYLASCLTILMLFSLFSPTISMATENGLNPELLDTIAEEIEAESTSEESQIPAELELTLLEEAKVEALTKASTDYTEESYALLTDALALPESTQEEVDAKVLTIKRAIAQLDEIATESEPQTPPEEDLLEDEEAEGEELTFRNGNVGDPVGYVTISVEKFTLGQGYFIEPIKVPFYEGDNVAKVLVDLLGEGNYQNTGDVNSGFYLAHIYDPNPKEVNIPQYILDESGSIEDRGSADWLGEFDYTFMSGWMYTVNNWFADVGASDWNPEDGDVIRWQFTVYGYGADLGGGWGSSYIEPANKDGLTVKVAEINSDPNKDTILSDPSVQAAYDAAYEVLVNMESSQTSVDEALAQLNNALDLEVSEVDTGELEEPITVISVEPVAKITVENGTEKEDIVFPEKITLNLSDSSKKEVSVTWACENYDAKTAANYTFVGSYELPEGVTGEKQSVSVRVSVKQPIFDFDKGTGAIKGYTGSGGDVVIPREIDGIPVTHIEDGAFSKKKITSIVIPDSVVSIGATDGYFSIGAFSNNQLTSLEIPSGVKIIGHNTFQNNQLTSVVIPEGVTDIGSRAFEGNQLTLVVIPDSVTNMLSAAFAKNKLTSVKISGNLETLEHQVFQENQLTSVTIPESIKIVGSSAFNKNKIKTIEIPDTVEKIDNWAFGFNELTSVKLPNKLKTIGQNAFKNNQLKTIDIPNTVTWIDWGAFANNQLTSVKIPESITTIESSTFQNNQLASVEIPKSITSIDVLAFADNQLTSVSVPESVTVIKRAAFQNNRIQQGEAKIDNYENRVSIEDDTFKNNGADGTIEINPTFLKEGAGDTEKPVITVQGLVNGQQVTEKEISFKVTVTDNVDENIVPIVKLNGNVITGTNGDYKAELIIGDNIILIEATDAAGNKSDINYKLIYKENPVGADLTAYNAVLTAVVKANYTEESWAAYQEVVARNVVTINNTQAEVDAATAAIKKAQANLVRKVINASAKEQLSKNLAFLYETVDNPTFGTFGGEWTVLSLARGEYGVPERYYDIYYNNVVNEVKKLMTQYGGKLHNAKGTEHSRAILGLTSIGKDITDVGGYDLGEALADFTYVKRQGINGPIFGLIAFDAHHYEIPVVEGVAEQTTRAKMISYILSEEKNGGGWALSGTKADPDITAMAIQGLTPYYHSNSDVRAAVDRAINWLSSAQSADGGYASWGTVNSESVAQVIVALTGLGIDPHKDTRFIKSGKSAVDNLMSFAVPEGGFKHIHSEKTENGMATDQGTYALVAYDRFLNGKTRLYDMTDVKIGNDGTPGNGGGTPPEVEKPTEPGTDEPEPGKPTPRPHTITLSIDKLTINKGYVLQPTVVGFDEGENVWDVLQREMDNRGISYRYSYSNLYDSVYVESIAGDGEFDHGSGSGWMYNVNGWYPNYGASRYILQDGDVVQWRYTTDLGADLGEDLSKWEDPKDSPGISIPVKPDEKNPVVDIPSNIDKDYVLDITKDHKDLESITLNIPNANVKLSINLEEVRDDIPNIIIRKEDKLFVINKGTKLRSGKLTIDIFAEAKEQDVIALVKEGLADENIDILDAFSMGSSEGTIFFDKPVTLTFKGMKGQGVGFIDKDKWNTIQIFNSEQEGQQATKDLEMQTYAFVDGNDLIVKTNHFTTFVLYATKEVAVEEVPSEEKKLMYADAKLISPWAYDLIHEATEKGFVEGFAGNINPKSNVTRAEFAKLMVSALGLDIKTDRASNFADVKPGDWFYPYVNAAYSEKIVEGFEGKFLPNDKITREEMAVMIVRALGIKDERSSAEIKDRNQVSSWAQSAVETIVSSNIMEGYDGKFNPRDLATREMSIVVAMRAYHYHNKGTNADTNKDTIKDTNNEEKDADKNEAKDEDEATTNATNQETNRSVKKIINKTASFMQKTITDPIVASIGGEWTVFGLARSGESIPSAYYDKYYATVERTLKEKSGVLHSVKYTEYDRVILALTAIGKDVHNVAGYDLREPLADFNKVVVQGINGPIFALIALDSHNYEIPIVQGVEVQTTREKLVDFILSREIQGGGWALGQNPTEADPDITAMAIQGLTPYYKTNEKVKKAVDRGVSWLSKVQHDDGGYASWGSLNSESVAQVIVALTGLGIDPHTDPRFVKKGHSALDALVSFAAPGGGFYHIKAGGKGNGGAQPGEVDAMATDQAMYALIAYDRFMNGKKRLYDMTDVLN